MNFNKISVIFCLVLFSFASTTYDLQAQCTGTKFSASTINNGKTGDEVKVNITADNFTDLSVFQWTMRWDPAVLQFVRIECLDLQDLTAQSFNILKADQGYFTTSWFNQSGVTKPNGSTLFCIVFKVIGADGKTTGVDFSNTPLRTEFADKNSQVCANVALTNGRVNIGTVVNPPVGASMTMGNANNIAQNGDVCIPMVITGFSKITAMQFSLSFDTTKLKYVTVQNFKGLTSFDRNNFGNPGGRVTCVWFDPNTTGQTVADGTSLFEICFKYQGSCPSSATVEVSDTPTKTDLIQAPNVKLSVTKTLGTINCSGVQNPVLTVAVAKATHPCPTQSNGAIQINVSGGTGTYTYLWTNGATTKDISNLAAGNYNVTVKDGANASTTLSAQVTLTAMAASTTKVDPTSGSNGSINLTVTGGNTPYTFLWSNNATTEDINNLAAGTFTYTVTDAAGCKATGSVTLNGGTPGLLDATSVNTNPACSGQTNGAINVTVTGGTAPYTFTWTGPNNFNATTEDLTALAAGTYRVTVKDAANATKQSDNIVLTSPAALTVTGTKKNPTSSNNDGTITLTVGGGTAPYTYRWSDGSTNKDRTSLPTGNYAVTVTDSKGCTNGAPFNLTTGTPSTCYVSSRVFTPNNDGINDLFQISCVDNNPNQLLVFNRYNQLVYSIDNYNNNWAGIGNSGLLVPDGTYYWVLKVSNNGVSEVYKGYVALLRALN